MYLSLCFKIETVIENRDRVSLSIPAYEPTNISYIIKVIHTGIDKIRVRAGLFTQSEIVTRVDAQIVKTLSAETHQSIAKPQFIKIKIKGKANVFTFLLLAIKRLSRRIPTKFGIEPAHAPRSI